VPHLVSFTPEMTKQQAIASGLMVHEPRVGSSGGGGSGGGSNAGVCHSLRKLVLDLMMPFRSHDFMWVFVSRLLVQMGIYTVQE
jgi:hypothetical protein